MTTYMHCRPYRGTDIPICSSSFLFVRPNYLTTSNYQTYTPFSYHYHDRAPHSPPSPVPVVTPRRRQRRLEDPVITYASNYYSTLPDQMSQLSSQQTSSTLPPQPPPLPPPRRFDHQSDRNSAYCDLFNLLERSTPPPSPINKQRKKYNSNGFNPRHYQHSTNSENISTKLKDTDDRKRHYQQPCFYKEKKHQDDKLSSTEQYHRSIGETKKINNVYQRHSPSKGFFRRVVRNYFCIPSMLANNGYSS